jgi:hypothetical protein
MCPVPDARAASEVFDGSEAVVQRAAVPEDARLPLRVAVPDSADAVCGIAALRDLPGTAWGIAEPIDTSPRSTDHGQKHGRRRTRVAQRRDADAPGYCGSYAVPFQR